MPPISPSPLSAPPLSHTLVLITILFVTRHMVIQGCFKTTSFDKNYSRTFFAISFAEKMHALFCRTIIPEISFPALPLLPFFFFLNEPCQLFALKELNNPVNPIMSYPWFYEWKGRHRRLTIAVYDSPSGSTNFQIQIIKYLAFVRSRRDLKEKNCRDCLHISAPAYMYKVWRKEANFTGRVTEMKIFMHSG
jgi:hypothetical protein